MTNKEIAERLRRYVTDRADALILADEIDPPSKRFPPYGVPVQVRDDVHIRAYDEGWNTGMSLGNGQIMVGAIVGPLGAWSEWRIPPVEWSKAPDHAVCRVITTDGELIWDVIEWDKTETVFDAEMRPEAE